MAALSQKTIALDDAQRAVRSAVVFDGVEKRYQSSGGVVQALKGISLSVRTGSIFGIIGRSGAGKSSLLRTINRLERPTGGRVMVDGEDIASYDEDHLVLLRRRIGMIFQHFNLISAKTVAENVGLPLRVAGVARAEIESRVAEVLALVGLEGKENTFPSRLSGGQKQRVGIARALVNRPEILLCDEATSALDPETTLSILSLLKDINRRLNLTIILITHEMSVIREICDEVLVLEQGEIAEQGPVWRIFGNPQHAATQALLKPLHRDLPDDVAQRLRRDGDRRRGDRAIIELVYTGEDGLEPDLGRIIGVLGNAAQLLQSALDRIQGHVHGRMLFCVDGDRIASLQALHPLAHRVKVLGHVAHDV